MGKTKFNLATHFHLGKIVENAKKMLKEEENSYEKQVEKAHLIALSDAVHDTIKFWNSDDSAIIPFYKGEFTKMKKRILKERLKIEHLISVDASFTANRESKELTVEINKLFCNGKFDNQQEIPHDFFYNFLIMVIELKALKNKELNKTFKAYLNLGDKILGAEGEFVKFVEG